jgi:hypothetical protein
MTCPHNRPAGFCPFAPCYARPVYTEADVDDLFGADAGSCAAEMAKMLIRNPGKPWDVVRINNPSPDQPDFGACNITIEVETSPAAKSEPPFACPNCGGAALGLGWLCAECGEAKEDEPPPHVQAVTHALQSQADAARETWRQRATKEAAFAQRLLDATPDPVGKPMPPNEDDAPTADNLLHQLWTWAVGLPGYDKSKWLALERAMWSGERLNQKGKR